MSTQVNAHHYFGPKYLTLERFISYFYQLDLARYSSGTKLLVIGVGDGIVPEYLRRAGLEVTTLDIDSALAPDVSSDVRTLPFADKAFDAALAFEVLEHIPFADVPKALLELARVARDTVIISVPHRRSGFEIVFKFPFIRRLLNRSFARLYMAVPLRFPGFAASKQHYWEIDFWTLSIGTFRRTLKDGFNIIGEISPVLDFYRRFFILKPK